MQIDLGVSRPRTAVEGSIEVSDKLPVIRVGSQGPGVEPRVPRLAAQGFHNGVEIGLAGLTAHGRNGAVDHIHSGLGSLEDGSRAHTAGVVGMEVNRNTHLLAQGFHQFGGGVGFAETRHVLDGQNVGAHLLQPAGHLEVVVEGVLGPSGIEDIAGVADGGLANGVGFPHRRHGDFHVFHRVQGIENTKDVNALPGRFLDEFGHHVVRVTGVSHRIGSPQQHLEADIGDEISKPSQPLPGVLVEEAQGGVEGGPTPHLQAEELGQPVSQGLGNPQNVDGTHPGGQQGLMGIPEGGVGDQQALLLPHPLGKPFRAQPKQALAGSRRRSGSLGEGNLRQGRRLNIPTGSRSGK